MVARAAAAARTQERILEAVIGLASERFLEDIDLEEIARRAGVTVQTVLRRFGNRQALLEAAVQRGEEAVEGPRRQVRSGDIEGAARRVVADYDRFGETIMRWLAQEERVPMLRSIVTRGREAHHAWVERVFAPQLTRRRGLAQRRLRAQLIAVTDVYTWKLLRRDLCLGRAETERAITELIRALLGDDVPASAEESEH
jgi:AcrR family transcriptional regulator